MRSHDDPHTWRSLFLAIGSVLAPVVACVAFGVACWWLQEGRYLP